MSELTNLLRRLEVATLRLEEIAEEKLLLQAKLKKEGSPSTIKSNNMTISKKSTTTTTMENNNASTKSSKIALEGNRWIIENCKDNHELMIEATDIRQTVYLYNCENCTIQVKGKINALAMDKCVKTGLIVDRIIASLDVITCCKVQLQILHTCSTISVDKTDGAMIYLSRGCIDGEHQVQVFTSKSSEINLSFPQNKQDEEKDCDMIEKAIPEQFRTIITRNGDLLTEHVHHASA